MNTRPSLLLVEKSRRSVLRNKPREARLGDGAGNIYAPDGMYWVKFAGPADENGNATYTGPASRVFGGAKNFIEQDGRGVYIKLNHKGQPEIDGPVYENLQAAGIKPSVIHANSPYRQFVRTRDIQDFMARRLSKTSMKVRVGELFYVDRNGIPQFYPGSTASTHADFTASIPATLDYECFALLSFDQDAFAASTPPYLTVSVSTPRAAVPNLSIANMIVEVQEAYTTRVPYSMPIQVYRLYNGMTGLGDPADLDNRQWLNVPIGISSLSPLTTKGDIFTYSTVNTRLPVGTNGQYLSADSAEATGLKWVTGSGGITQLTGDVTAGPGSGSQAATLATVNADVGTHAYPTSITANAKGLITGITAGTAPDAPPFVDTTALVKGSGDATKLLRFEVDGFTTATTRVMTPPNYDGTLATLAGAETLTNKTITGATVSGGTIDNTPIGTTTRALGYFSALRLYISGFAAIFAHAFTADRNVTLPGDANVTLVGESTVQTLSGKTLTTPTIGSFTNAQHNHSNAAGGGNLTGAAFGAQSSNTFLAGPTSGSAATPTFRGIFADDLLGCITIPTLDGVIHSDTVDPTPFDDELAGYLVGHWWINLATGQVFQSVDDTDDAAVWARLSDLPRPAILRDEKATGTAGGTSSNTTWNARDLNTELYDPDSIVSISSNQFTPIAGDYEILVFTPFTGGSAASSLGRCRLYNVGAGAAVEEGISTFALTNAAAMGVLACKFTATGSQAYRIDTYTSVGRATNGLGVAVSDGSAEVYTQITLRKIS